MNEPRNPTSDQIRTRACSRLLDGAPHRHERRRDGQRYRPAGAVEARAAPVGRSRPPHPAAGRRPRFGSAAMRVAEEYLRKAEECERLASQVSDLTIKSEFADLARQWRDLAKQAGCFRHGPDQSR
jgi:hypothetical protein